MHVSEIEYEGGGLQLIGHLAYDDTVEGTRPAVLVCHEGPGLDDHAKWRAEQLAGLGYIAFALDYHGGGVPLPMDQVMARLGPMFADPTMTRVLGRAGLDVLLAQPQSDASRVAAIGYCFGGTMALELARGGADLKAVVGFHSGSPPPGRRTPRTSRAASSCASEPTTRSSRPSSAPPSRRRCATAASTGG